MNYSEATEVAKKWDKKFTCDQFVNAVTIIHRDGSYFYYDGAFLANIGKDFLAVFAEHHPARVFDKSDLISYNESEYTNTYKELA